MRSFLTFLKATNPVMAKELFGAGGASGALAGSKEFVDAWKKLARDQPQQFFDAQHLFIKKTLYEPQSNSLRSILGIDVAKRSKAIQDVLWSISVQHGNTTPKIFQRALDGRQADKVSDKELIQAVYAERSKVDKYFSKSTPEVQKSVLNRFKKEEAEALQMLDPVTMHLP